MWCNKILASFFKIMWGTDCTACIVLFSLSYTHTHTLTRTHTHIHAHTHAHTHTHSHAHTHTHTRTHSQVNSAPWPPPPSLAAMVQQKLQAALLQELDRVYPVSACHLL